MRTTSSTVSSLARLNADGSLDVSFTPELQPSSSVQSITTQSGGRIIAAGYGLGGLTLVARLNADGTSDRTVFGGEGVFGSAYAMAWTRTNELLVGGYIYLANRIPVANLVRMQMGDYSGKGTFEVSPAVVSEAAGEARVSIRRSWSTDGAVTIEYRTIAGSAEAGADFVAQTGGVVFEAGEVEKQIGVPIVDDRIVEPIEAFQIALDARTEGASVGPEAVAAIEIASDDVALEFSGNQAFVAEHVPQISFWVARRGDLGGAVSVDYRTESDSAMDNQDFMPTSGRINFGPGDELVKFITIPIVNDDVGERDEAFYVRLFSPSNASLGEESSVKVTIVDDGGHLEFGSRFHRVLESAGTASIVVQRLNTFSGSAGFGSVSVRFTTRRGTATAGEDYVEQTGILNFAAGEAARTINVQLKQDAIPEHLETFFISLSEVTGDTVLGRPELEIVIIDESFGQVGGSADPGFVASTLTNNAVHSISIAPDGKIAVAGSLRLTNETLTALARFLPDGQLDRAFAPDIIGPVYTSVFDAEGRLWIGGAFNVINAIERPYLARLLPDGTADPALSGLAVPFIVKAIAIQKDGKVIAAGQRPNQGLGPIVMRFNPDGTIDPTFALLSEAFGISPYRMIESIAIQPDGKILVAGANSVSGQRYDQPLIRLLPNGAFDPDFKLGVVEGGYANVVAVLPDGRIMLGGAVYTDSVTRFHYLVRLLQDGSFDSTFPQPGPDGTVRNIAVDSQGRILISGEFFRVQDTESPFVARLQPSGALDYQFFPSPGPDNAIYALAVDANDDVYIGGAFFQVDGEQRLNLSRLTAGEQLKFTSIRRGPNLRVRLGLNVVPNRPLLVEASSDLAQWTQVSSFVPVANSVEIVDTNAPPHQIRFYRGRQE